MSVWEEFLNWCKNPQGYKWADYYNLFIAKKWHRESKQRNYQRNKDIIYNSNTSKRNGFDVGYEIIGVEDGDFFLDGQNLKLEYEDKGYSSDMYVDRIRPFNFICMKVDDEMNLVADMPNMLLDAEFKIDNNGNLILNYG